MSESEGPAYVFEDRAEEERRLIAQARLFDPTTRRLLQRAGLEPGMRVLELGSGAGNVAQVAAGIVGPDGSVTGVERDPEAVARTRRRLAAEGVGNVTLVEGDVQRLDGVEGPFDAVVGRLILMYLPDPAAALRRAAALVRGGGLVCFEEADLAYEWAIPAGPLWGQVRTWFLQALEGVGAEARMGLKLHRAFRAAGLDGPEMVSEAIVVGGDEAPSWGWAGVVRGALPVMERLGIATADQLGAATLAERLHAERAEADAVVIGPVMVGAWARVG